MIRVAVLGGGIGAQHIEAYRALPEFKVTMVVDQDQSRLAHLAADEIVLANDVQIALDADVDVIDICLPPHLHSKITIEALQSGKHVICEKPLATSLAQIRAIGQAKKATGRSVFPVFQYRFGPNLQCLQALKGAGLTGVPRAAAVETHWNRGPDYYAIPWRGTWAGEQGGAIVGHAIHAHDLLMNFMAPVVGVAARLGTLVNSIETEDSAAVIFELSGGGLATSSITLGAARDETRLRFVYEHVTVTSDTTPYAPGEGNWQFVARDPKKQSLIDSVIANNVPSLTGFSGFLREVSKSITGQPNQAVAFDDGADSIALITAIYEAHRSGAWVSLPISIDHSLWEGWEP
ncbi:MAG: Gfo/Idh/MocA family oxidoreductase [Tateyamaria sp.]|jgi:predicted dehydrogenase|nr:Gfo/Idh/MocA family oxidoreductase [Tateyamaria sp.]